MEGQVFCKSPVGRAAFFGWVEKTFEILVGGCPRGRVSQALGLIPAQTPPQKFIWGGLTSTVRTHFKFCSQFVSISINWSCYTTLSQPPLWSTLQSMLYGCVLRFKTIVWKLSILYHRLPFFMYKQTSQFTQNLNLAKENYSWERWGFPDGRYPCMYNSDIIGG